VNELGRINSGNIIENANPMIIIKITDIMNDIRNIVKAPIQLVLKIILYVPRPIRKVIITE
tara:strand:- start:394 stop:576 length:183 start_codon:yes stop_codon:yes gene_type:complete